MTDDEIRRLVKLAVHDAIHETLITLGVDSTMPVEMQKDIAFIRAWRLSSEAVRRQGLLTATGVLIVGMLGLIWLAIKGSPL